MELSALAGNSRIKDQLSNRAGGRELSHAYVISGPTGSGRHTLAGLLAAAMVCTGAGDPPCGACVPCKKVRRGLHPDVAVITGPGENKPITVDQVRALRADAYIRPNEGERKIYLLEQADQMNQSAQNAMLKLLEEGPSYAAFLLMVNNPGGLLQTVRSRCEELALTPLTPMECQSWLSARFPDKSQEELRAAALDCQGILGRAVEALNGTGSGAERAARAEALAAALESAGELDLFQASIALDRGSREELTALLDALESELGRRMARSPDRRRLFRAVELVRTLREAAQLNANPGQLAGWLCAGMFVKENFL